MRTQDGARQYIPGAALRQMDDFGEDDFGSERFFGREMARDFIPERFVRMAKSAQQTRPGRAGHVIQTQAKITCG